MVVLACSRKKSHNERYEFARAKKLEYRVRDNPIAAPRLHVEAPMPADSEKWCAFFCGVYQFCQSTLTKPVPLVGTRKVWFWPPSQVTVLSAAILMNLN